MTKEARKIITNLRWQKQSDAIAVIAIVIISLLLVAGWYFGAINFVPNYHAELRADGVPQ